MEYRKNTLKSGIRNTVRMIAVIAFGAGQDKKKLPKFVENSAEDSFYLKLIDMIDAGEICEAENQLLQKLQVSNTADLKVAIDVYAYMNEKEDEFLEENNFSRQEIEWGIKQVIRDSGYGYLIWQDNE